MNPDFHSVHFQSLVLGLVMDSFNIDCLYIRTVRSCIILYILHSLTIFTYTCNTLSIHFSPFRSDPDPNSGSYQE